MLLIIILLFFYFFVNYFLIRFTAKTFNIYYRFYPNIRLYKHIFRVPILSLRVVCPPQPGYSWFIAARKPSPWHAVLLMVLLWWAKLHNKFKKGISIKNLNLNDLPLKAYQGRPEFKVGINLEIFLHTPRLLDDFFVSILNRW